MTKGHDVEVRPCPFCGKTPEFWNESHGGRVYSMQCACGCELGWEMSEEDILEKMEQAGDNMTKGHVDMSEKMKRVAEARQCPYCGRKNALSFFPGDRGMDAVCRWCKWDSEVYAKEPWRYCKHYTGDKAT